MKCKIVDHRSFREINEQCCGGGKCPRILVNDEGDAIVQGLSLDISVKDKFGIPNGEDMVYIPSQILHSLLEHINFTAKQTDDVKLRVIN